MATLCNSVDKEWLPVKGIYFFFMAAVGDLLPFIPVIMKQFGLTATEMGIIYGVMPFVSFFIRPVFGAIADKTRGHKVVLIVCIYLTGLFYGLLLLTPTSDHGSALVMKLTTTLQCSPQDSYFQTCTTSKYNNNSSTVNGVEKSVCSAPLSNYGDTVILPENRTNIQCKATCSGNEVTDSEMNVCFMKSVGTFQPDCNATWAYSIQSLEFTISDVASVVRNEVVRNYSNSLDILQDNGKLTCRDYDLKFVSYQGMDFYQLTCDTETELDCVLTCDDETHPDCSSTPEMGKTFWTFFVIFLFCNIFFAPVISLVDAIVYDILGDKRGQWGKQRLWGTVGFAIFAVTSTIVMDVIGRSRGGMIDYSISFYIFIGLCFIAAKIAFVLKVSGTLKCNKMFVNLSSLFKYPEVLIFLIMMIIYGWLNVVPEVLLFWYLQEMGSSQILLGLCLLCSCCIEVVILFVAGKIIKKIGHMACLYLSLIAYTIRFFCYSFLTHPWYVLPVELLHGVTFGLTYAAASGYASLISPPGMMATIQGLLGGLYFGFGKGVGGLVSGKLFDSDGGLGPVWTWRFYGFFSLGLLLIYIAINAIIFRKPLGQTQELKKEPNTVKDDPGHQGVVDSLLGTNNVNTPTTEL